MKYNITRRDFLNGMAIATGTGLLTPTELFAQTSTGGQHVVYPPTLTGIRGNHAGSFETMHALAWAGQKPEAHHKLDEHYDMVIVGAGISGLATAWFYQKAMGPEARILLLDNHDDFGGHAKRNEFHHRGRTLLGIGGSINVDTPSDWSEIAKGLLDDLGVDLEAMKANLENVPLLSSTGDSLLAFPGQEGKEGHAGHTKIRASWSQLMLGVGDYKSAVRALPLPASEQDKLIELFSGEVDYLDDLPQSEKQTYVESVSYAQFLTERVGLADATITIFYPVPKLMFGPAALRVSVMEAFYLGCPGMQSMDWLNDLTSAILDGMKAGSKSLYFPDGNASLARLLVHKLIPSVAPDTHGFDDIAASRFDYGALDNKSHPTRLRLNSTVVGVRETGDDAVTVDYVRDGNAVSVTGDHCVLACYNGAIPYLCPQLPESQKEALRYGVKVPLVMTNVLIDNGHAYSKLGVGEVTCPNDPYVLVIPAPATTTGGHQPPRGPDDPMVIHLLGVPSVTSTGNETSHDLLKQARHNVYATTFDTYESQVRGQLQGLLGEHGFNHKTDIKAITVNRWPHGYAYEYMSLDDPKWTPGQAPHELGRAQFGRISIANSDSEAYAYLNAAIDAGWRAVTEQVTYNHRQG